MRKYLSPALKITVTVIGLYIALRQVDVNEVAGHLGRADLGWVVLAFGLVLLSLAVRALRWQRLLRGLGVKVPFRRLLTLYFVGNFFNAVLPAGLGGDAVRIVEVARDVPGNVAAGTVIVDRLTGLMMQFVLVLLALPFRPAGFDENLRWLLTVMAGAGLVGGFVLLDGRVIRRLGGWLPGPLSPVGDGPIAKLLNAVQGCGWPAVWQAMGISLIFNLMLFGWWTAIGTSLDYDISYTYYMLVVSVMSLALLAPSIGGLGTREALAPTLFAGAGLNEGQAVALSLLVFFTLRVTGVVGAAVYIVSTIRNRRTATTGPP